jgi:hypothetical protein
MIALITPPSLGLQDQLRFLGRTLGLVLSSQMGNEGTDAKFGLDNFIAKEKLAEYPVLFIDCGNSGGWFLREELRLYRSKGIRPKFFSFLEGLSGPLASETKCSYFVAADEWAVCDEVLFFSGYPTQIVEYLSLTKSIDLPLWNPQTGDVQETDRYPTVFELVPGDPTH